MRLALLLTSALALVAAQVDDEEPTTTTTRRSTSRLSTITPAPTAIDTFTIVLPSTTSTPPPSNDPPPGYSVNDTSVTYPTSKDWWVVNGTGVVQWKWGGDAAAMISVWLMNNGTMYNGAVTAVGRMANTLGSSRNLTRIVGLYATEINPGHGYYVKLTKTVSGPVGPNNENLDTIYAESTAFEIKAAGSKLTFPKGFPSAATRAVPLAGGVLALSAVVAVLL